MRFNPSRAGLFAALLVASACAPRTDLASASTAEDPEAIESFADPIVLAAQTSQQRFAPGEILASDREICLGEGEKVTLLNADGEHELAGPGCKLPVAGNFVADQPPEPEPIEDADRALRVASGSDTALQRYPLASEIGAERVCLKEYEQLELRKDGTSTSVSGPGCYPVPSIVAEIAMKEAEEGRRRMAQQETQQKSLSLLRAAPPPAPRSEEFYVYRGSKSALARYPRGTSKAKYKQICLKGKERLTLVSKAGRKMTYGAGCDTRVPTPGDTNSGATSIGSLYIGQSRETGIGE